MAILRTAKSYIDRLKNALNPSRPKQSDPVAARMAQLTSAIYARECEGEETTLRQLHKISDLSQPEALNTVSALERAGIVKIDTSLTDAFESLVVLTEDAKAGLQSSLESSKQEKAA